MAAPRPGRVTVLLAAIGALAAVLVLLRVSEWGPEARQDTMLYVSAARNLLAGEGFTGYRGVPYSDAAPFFPFALALVGLSGLDPLAAAGWINAAAFGLTAFAAAAWVRRRARSAFLAVWAGLACALSPPLAAVASSALTEPLFVLFVTLSLFALDRYREGGGRSLLLAAAACAALACATRYLGLALVAAALPLLLTAGRRGLRPPRRGIEDASLFAAVALAPLGAWMLRNLLAVGSPTGRFYPGVWDALVSLDQTTAEFARWTLGEGGYARLRAIAEALPGGAPPPDGGASIPLVALQAATPLALASVAAAAAAFARRRGGAWPGGGLAVPLAFASVYGPATLFLAWRLGFGLEAAVAMLDLEALRGRARSPAGREGLGGVIIPIPSDLVSLHGIL